MFSWLKVRRERKRPEWAAKDYPEIKDLVDRLYAKATPNEQALAGILGECWMGHTHALIRLLLAREIIRLEAEGAVTPLSD